METVRYDLTVVGAGIAGMCAAIAAARHGMKVALVHDRPVLGGSASSEVAVSISGAASGGGSRSVYARECGIVEEIKLTRLFYNQTATVCHSYQDWPMEDAAYFDMIYNEKNIDLYLNASVRDAETENGRIKSVVAVQLGSEKEIRFESQLFADCTGDGMVGYKAGALYRWGEEAKSEFNESLAPEEATKIVMGSTVLLFTRDAGEKVTYKRPAFAYDVTKLDYFDLIGNDALARGIHKEGNVYSGYWWIEIGGLLDTISDNESITLELRKLVYGLWDYIKNSGKFEGVDNLILDKVTQIAGKRESRRFVGDYILNENDIEEKTEFDDAVSMGGWSMDVHAPHGIYDSGPATHWHPNNGIYNIPFRSMYSRNIFNLLFAGRNISCTHIAMGSTRVMGTCGCMGQAVGTAAALCKEFGILPAQVDAGHMAELRELLVKDDQTIMGARESCNPELLRDLTVTASSVKKAVNESGDTIMKLDDDYCLALPVKERLNSLELHVKNDSHAPQQLYVHLYGGTRPENYIPDTFLKEVSVEIPGSFDGWITLPVGVCACGDRKVYLMFRRQDELSVYCNTEKLTGIVTFIWRENQELEKYPRTGRFFQHRQEKNICFRSALPEQQLYGPENLINGYSRPYGLPNIWISDDGGEQTVNLEYGIPKKINELHLVFNTQLEYDNFNEFMPDLIRDYSIETTLADGTKEVIETHDNYLRVSKHVIGKSGVKSLKIILKSTYGSPRMQMYAIKLF